MAVRAVTAKAGAARVNAERGAVWPALVCVVAAEPVAKWARKAPAAVAKTRWRVGSRRWSHLQSLPCRPNHEEAHRCEKKWQTPRPNLPPADPVGLKEPWQWRKLQMM